MTKSVVGKINYTNAQKCLLYLLFEVFLFLFFLNNYLSRKKTKISDKTSSFLIIIRHVSNKRTKKEC